MSKTSTVRTSDTREQIISAATGLFYKGGVHHVSFQQIANEVKISQPAIYRHFKDKDDLIVACTLKAAESGRELIDDLVSGQNSPLEKLYAYIRGNLIWVIHKPKEANMLLAMYYFSSINFRLKEILMLVQNQSEKRVQSQLDKLKQKSKLVNTVAMSRAIHDILLGEMIKTFHAPDEMSIEQRMTFLKILITAVIKNYPS